MLQVYAAPPTSQPYVYINNVTANVNVHHGAEQPQVKSMPVNSHPGSGFPPPPPNPMAFANPPVVSAPGPIPNGIGIHQSPHGAAYIYQQQVAALAAKAGAAQYMPVIYYPYPIPVSQQTPPTGVPHPSQVRGPQPNMMRNNPNNFPPNLATSANEVYYQQQIHAPPQQTPVIATPVTIAPAVAPKMAPAVVPIMAPPVVPTLVPAAVPALARAETPTPNQIPAAAVAAIATSTTEEKTVHVELIPSAESEAEQTKTKTIPPKPETLESPPNSVTTKEVANTDEKKPPVKVPNYTFF
jgi:hypothetical protein